MRYTYDDMPRRLHDEGHPLPVTVALSRRALPDHERDLYEWATALCATAARFPGYLRSHVGEHHGSGRRELLISMTFSCAEDLAAWEASEQRARQLARGDALTDGMATEVAQQILDRDGSASTPPPLPFSWFLIKELWSPGSV